MLKEQPRICPSPGDLHVTALQRIRDLDCVQGVSPVPRLNRISYFVHSCVSMAGAMISTAVSSIPGCARPRQQWQSQCAAPARCFAAQMRAAPRCRSLIARAQDSDDEEKQRAVEEAMKDPSVRTQTPHILNSTIPPPPSPPATTDVPPPRMGPSDERRHEPSQACIAAHSCVTSIANYAHARSEAASADTGSIAERGAWSRALMDWP